MFVPVYEFLNIEISPVPVSAFGEKRDRSRNYEIDTLVKLM